MINLHLDEHRYHYPRRKVRQIRFILLSSQAISRYGDY
jgi:hypothetical protein